MEKNFGVMNTENSRTEFTYWSVAQKTSLLWSDLKYTQYEIAADTEPGAYLWNGSSVVYDENWINPSTLTQHQIDYRKYTNRAKVKDSIIATMASNNMQRVRSGIWSVENLISLTQDSELKLILDDVSTLSYELAIGKIEAATNPLLTAGIKTEWISLLAAHLNN